MPTATATPESVSQRRTAYSVHVGPDTTLRPPSRVRRTVLIAHPPVVNVYSAKTPAISIISPPSKPGIFLRTASEKTPSTADFPGQVNPSNIAERRGGRFRSSANLLDGIESETGAGLGKTKWQPSIDRGHSMADTAAAHLPYMALQPSIPGSEGLPSLRSPMLPVDSPPPTAIAEQPALPKRLILPYISRHQTLSPREFEHSPEHYVKAYDERKRTEREKAIALAALEGTLVTNADDAEDESDLPVYLRGLRTPTSRSTNRQQKRTGSFRMPPQQVRPVPAAPAPVPQPSTRPLSHHTRLSRHFDNCEFDVSLSDRVDSVRSCSVYSAANTDGQCISELPVQPACVERPLPSPPPRHLIARKPVPTRTTPHPPRKPTPPHGGPDLRPTFIIPTLFPDHDASSDEADEGNKEEAGDETNAALRQDHHASSRIPESTTIERPRPAPLPPPVLSPSTMHHRLATLRALEMSPTSSMSHAASFSRPAGPMVSQKQRAEHSAQQRPDIPRPQQQHCPEPRKREAFNPLRGLIQVFSSREQALKKQQQQQQQALGTMHYRAPPRD
ncbi:hypothetical protein CERZMDRAFT_95272 [Cercospora zeae-maydis SCOH1-5]|uniref:Uncharacterized protein n=1 Tax=Cercospora zeae-maydis SCOH1-5 TaxID=717836 RepID=A0A6A6FNE7_9PEZI|nr:hypothetical protein CERZMDRAFT_95272 [Cercospora zeae-maydis SCOH1-5]